MKPYLRHYPDFSTRPFKTVYCAAKACYIGPAIWELVPAHLKNVESLGAFKYSIKSGSQRTLADSVRHTLTRWVYLFEFLSFFNILYIFVL